MTDKGILEKAIRKASKNGFDPSVDALGRFDDNGDIIPEVLIFNQEFAKALWGEEGPVHEDSKSRVWSMTDRPWQYHLKQMVIADNPIEYLGKHLG